MLISLHLPFVHFQNHLRLSEGELTLPWREREGKEGEKRRRKGEEKAVSRLALQQSKPIDAFTIEV